MSETSTTDRSASTPQVDPERTNLLGRFEDDPTTGSEPSGRALEGSPSAPPSRVPPASNPSRRRWLGLLSVLLAGALVTLDLLLPLGVAVGLPYVLLIVITLPDPRREATWLAALGATVCVIAGGLLSPEGATPAVATANRTLAVITIWGVAWLCLTEKRQRSSLIRAARDVERELAARRAAEERFRRAVESTPNGLLLVGAEGSIVLANEMAERMFGYDQDELLGQSIDVLVPDEHRPDHPRYRRVYQNAPETRRMGQGRDLRGRRKDGSEFPVEVGLNPISTDEGTMVMSAVVDITERARARAELQHYAAELERSNNELNAFARIASHDLKSPLRAIAQLASWIREDAGEQLPRESLQHLTTLEDRAARLRQLLDDLMDFSSVGRSEEEIQEVDVEALVRDVVIVSDIPPEFTVEIGGLPRVHTQAYPLQQVFLNLIQNSVKHHDRPSGRVAVRGQVRDDDSVEYEVEDDGPGIEEQHYERAFEVLQTLRPRDEGAGSGLGLAIVRKTVEGLGGRIRIEPATPRGARFVFTVRDQRSVGTSAGPTPTLVLVEDDRVESEAIRRGVQRSSHDWSIREFCDGVDALACLRGETGPPIEEPFMILLDLNMPRMSGIEFLKHLRRDPRYRDTPVVVLTTSEHPDDFREAQDLGVSSYLPKSAAGEDYAAALSKLEDLLPPPPNSAPGAGHDSADRS